MNQVEKDNNVDIFGHSIFAIALDGVTWGYLGSLRGFFGLYGGCSV